MTPSSPFAGTVLEPVADRLHVDFDPPARQPAWALLAAATVVAVAGSLAADALVVAVGTRIFPSTRGYVHFQFADYARLTVIGVLGACAGWPVVTRISSRPRWLFSRMAVLVTLVLFAPDAWIYLHGSPAKAVAVLLAMHVAIALVTYHALVRLAPTGPDRRGRRGESAPSAAV